MNVASRRSFLAALGLTATALVAALAPLPAAAQAPAGKLVLYTSQPERDASQTVAAFRKAYPGVEVDVFRSGTTEVMGKLAAEFSAGQPKADVLLIADAASMESLKRDGRLLPYADAKVAGLAQGSFDADRTYFGSKLITTGIAVNTNAKSRPSSWADLAKPEYKGQIAMPSPLYSGAAAIMLGTMTARPDLGWSYFEKLKAADTVAVRGNGAVMTAVANGEKPYGVLVDFMAFNAKAKGSPIDFVFPAEGLPAVTEPVAILKTTANVAARARVRRLHPVRRRPEARGGDGLHPRPCERRHAAVAAGRHAHQPDAHRHRPGGAGERREPEALRGPVRQLSVGLWPPVSRPIIPHGFPTGPARARRRAGTAVDARRRRRRAVAAAAGAARGRGADARRRVVGHGRTSCVDGAHDVDGNGPQPRRRRSAGRCSPRSSARSSRWWYAHRHARTQCLRVLLRDAAAARAAGGGARLAVDGRPVEHAVAHAWAGAGDGQPQPAVFGGRHRAVARRAVRAARVPHRARGAARTAAGADRGGPGRWRATAHGRAHDHRCR